jgi:CubicO group peptidase (beta-lactamase class C family)
MFTKIKTPFLRKALVGSLLLFFSIHILAQTDPLPRSNPEKEGVPAQAIQDFIQAVGRSHNEFHSFMFVRHGKVIAEGWWNPYAPDLKHTLYSTSKSFTAAAVGFALTEKKLKLNDKVISFFPPEELPNPVLPYLAELTVKDALIMSDGQDPDPSGKVVTSGDWAKTFLATPIVNKPGTKFLYNSAGTYMLSAIVQRVTGEKVIDYLRPRLFEPLGITGEDWETSPQDVNTGGWGLRLKTEDMAKFGLLYLNGGRWKGRQILPKAWVREATTSHIMQDPNAQQEKKDASDWLQGYCYQMWRCRHNGVRADGAFGQYIIMLPDQDAVIAITSETSNMQDELNLVWQYLLPSMAGKALKEDREADMKLQRSLAALALPPGAVVANTGEFDANVNGKTYALQTNAANIKAIGFRLLEDHSWQVTIKGDTADHIFTFGNGSWMQALTTRPGPNLVSAGVHHFVGIPPVKTAGSYYWKDPNTLVLVLRYIESPHTEMMTCHFEGSTISIDHENSFDFGTKKLVITGTVQ